MNSVNIKRVKSIYVPKRIYNVFFSKYEYIHARCIHMRKIEYLTIGIDKYLPLYMCRYTDKVTKMYKYMYMYTHPHYILTYVHLGLHICTDIQMHRHTHNIYIYIYIYIYIHAHIYIHYDKSTKNTIQNIYMTS